MLKKLLALFGKSGVSDIASDALKDVTSDAVGDALGDSVSDSVSDSIGEGANNALGKLAGKATGKAATKSAAAGGDLDAIVEQRVADRVAELNELFLTADVEPAGYVATQILNLELARLRELHNLAPEVAQSRRQEFVQTTLQKVKSAPSTVFEPAGTLQADISYVNFMGMVGDGLILMRKQGNPVLIAYLEEFIGEFGRPGDDLAAAILDGRYNETMWQEHADRAMDMPEDPHAGDRIAASTEYTGEEAAFDAMKEMFGQAAAADGPETQPIQGVSLHDYVAGAALLQTGTSVEELTSKLGIERVQWDNAAKEWQQRLADHPMTVGMQYTTLLSTPHPVLSGDSAGGGENSARLTTDRDFYVEVSATANALSVVGMDAGTHLKNEWGLTVAEVGSAGVKWMSDPANMMQVMGQVSLRQAELEKKFAAEFDQMLGGGIADDIEF